MASTGLAICLEFGQRLLAAFLEAALQAFRSGRRQSLRRGGCSSPTS
jgi:hypothetical protein